jgi:hypothetical protein
MIPDNSDAAFSTQTNLPKPSDLLLHYNYGAAAVKMWGHGIDVLRDNTAAPRPPTPQPVKMELSRSIHDRTMTIKKSKKAPNLKRGGGRNPTAGPSRPTRRAHQRDTNGGNAVGGPGIEDSEDQARWDEDDVMLFLWGNSNASKD